MCGEDDARLHAVAGVRGPASTTLNKAAREAAAKAQAIENAVYGLKAVNPNRKTVIDTRTLAVLLALIEAKGREIAEALTALRTLQ